MKTHDGLNADSLSPHPRKGREGKGTGKRKSRLSIHALLGGPRPTASALTGATRPWMAADAAVIGGGQQ